jgi:ribosomal-protein-alanine N-acetyltransferase
MIIEMDQTHLPEVLEIERASFSIPWNEEMFRFELMAPYSYSWVWLEDDPSLASNRVKGYLIAWLEYEDFHIANLAVSQEARRQGIARQLLEYSLAWGRAHHAERSLLEVRTSNLAARNLYASLGYQIIATRRKWYDCPVEDGLLLGKSLDVLTA